MRAAYRFLSQAGYINFGVAPAIKERVRTGGPKATMIVIGAGLAGLAAARQLLAFGHKVRRARPLSQQKPVWVLKKTCALLEKLFEDCLTKICLLGSRL